MPILVNGDLVPEEFIREESERAASLAQAEDIADPLERSIRVREAAEAAAIDRTLFRQVRDQLGEPVDSALVEEQLDRLRREAPEGSALDEAALRREIEETIKIEGAFARLIGPIPPARKTEIAQFYNMHLERFREPEKVRVSHIYRKLGSAPDDQIRLDLSIALGELERGESFAEVAKRHSDDKREGGALGWAPRGALGPEFDGVVFAMRPGERSPVFQTPLGFHIVEVHERREARTAELVEVRPRIERAIHAMRQRSAMEAVMKQLRETAEIRRISRREAEDLQNAPAAR